MSKITREEIENKKIGVLVDSNRKSRLLVSFGGVRQGIEIPVFEFFNSISEIDCDKIFLRDFSQAWYQKGVDRSINDVDRVIHFLTNSIRKNQYKKVCFLGNSMGAYAAILFGTMLNVDRVISFAPQTFIDRWHRLLYADKRWKTEIKSIYAYENKIEEYFDLKQYLNSKNNYKTKIDIYYSPTHRLDKAHAERMRKSLNIKLTPIKEGGHGVVKTVIDNGSLVTLVEEALSEKKSEYAHV
ncbi:MAG: hypothetical protein AAF944_02225 [Bacteroidota bacterium]